MVDNGIALVKFQKLDNAMLGKKQMQEMVWAS
jgi:hypothetical protein